MRSVMKLICIVYFTVVGTTLTSSKDASNFLSRRNRSFFSRSDLETECIESLTTFRGESCSFEEFKEDSENFISDKGTSIAFGLYDRILKDPSQLSVKLSKLRKLKALIQSKPTNHELSQFNLKNHFMHVRNGKILRNNLLIRTSTSTFTNNHPWETVDRFSLV